MINILASLGLAGAVARSENPGQLLGDVETLYGLYAKAKAGQLDIKAMAASGALKPALQAAARVTAEASKLADDPAQFKNITDLLSSI